MPSNEKEQIIAVIREIEAEYKAKCKAAGDDLFRYLFSRFFPRIDTKNDYIARAKEVKITEMEAGAAKETYTAEVRSVQGVEEIAAELIRYVNS
jgi:hypothetical protein